MENLSELVVYRASAGSGKTFTLAVEYIKLLIKDPTAYRNILAVTFTNKATTEMKERILGQLYGMAIGDPASEAYLKKVCDELNLTSEEVCIRAKKAVSLLIHDYSRFRVETIDSFFQSVIRNLARELELGANINVSLNNDEVLSEAVDSMIEKLSRRSFVLGWLLEFIQERISSDKRWNVLGEIKSFGWNIFDETYMEKGDALREKLKNPESIPHYRKLLEKLRAQSVDRMQSFAEQFFDVVERNGLEPEDLFRGKNGIMSYFVKLRSGKYGDDLVNATVQACLKQADNWASKTSKKRAEIIALATSDLLPLLQDAEKFRSKDNVIVTSCDLSLRYINQMRLLTHIDEEVRELNRKENRFLLSDTNNLLRQLMQEGDSSFVFEKIGTQLKHVMIDEFQDTSRMQWNNFRMLLLEGLSQGSGSLIVGDVKQSIYRWRNGDWSILNNLRGKMEGVYPIVEKQLTTNRRSEGNIIHFNNEVFTKGCNWLNDIYKAKHDEDCHDLLQAYCDVCQDSPKEVNRGYVRMEFVEDDEIQTYVEKTLHKLAEQVENLVKRGVMLKDIAILVRKNKNIPVIADYFSQHLPYRIVSDEAFRLDSSSCICALIDALRYLVDENDSIALACLAAMYQNEVLHNKVEWNVLPLCNLKELVPLNFMEKRKELRLLPLYELLESLYHIFHLSEVGGQEAYLFAFLDCVIEYLQDHSSDLDSFLNYWDEKLCAKTIPSGELEGIRIYSIHKSKGLEFHTVLLPFCDWSLENEVRNQMIWCTPDKEPYDELNIVPVNYSTAMLQSVYEKDYQKEQLQLWVDNLNLLYVAFTRASKNLFVWAKGGKSNSVSELLESVQNRVAEALDVEIPMDMPFEFGELCMSEPEKKKDVDKNCLTRIPEGHKVRMESFQNKIDFRQSNRSMDFIRGDEEEDEQGYYIKQGRLLHYLFSVIHTADDVDDTLQQMLFEGLFDSEQNVERVRDLVKRALARKEAKDWFSGTWKLFNECSIVYMENGELQTRRPDRVMIKDKKVVVVDFKFGKKSMLYDEQVRGYLNLLKQMGYANVQGYLWYVYKNELIEVEF